MTLKHVSRRTIMSGEVVTFADDFISRAFGMLVNHDARGPFEISASRDAVMVHQCEIISRETLARFQRAIDLAYAAHERLRAAGHGAESLFPSTPTEIQ